MKLILNTKDIEEPKGIVYVLNLRLEEQSLVKVGVTTRRIEERVCEILTSIWKRYRVFPECVVKRYKTTPDMFKKESLIHSCLAEHRYTTKFVFSGSTEIFNCSLDKVVGIYDEIVP